LAPGCFTCCEPTICPKGFANCDDDPMDCETAFGADGSCTPERSGGPPPSFGVPVLNGDGSYFIGGRFFEATDFDPGAGDDIRTPVGDSDAYVSAYSAAGDYRWTYTFGRGVGEFNVASGADGSAYVGGALIRDELRPPNAPPEEIFGDGFVLRLGADGAVLWRNVFEAATTDAGSGGLVTSDGAGNAVLQIGFAGDVDFDPTSGVDVRTFGPYGQGYLIEFDPNGAMLWSRAVGDGACVFHAVLLDASQSSIAMYASANLGCHIEGKPVTSTRRGYMPVLVFTREGTLRDLWMLGGLQVISGVLAYDDGSVVISGRFAEELRLGDPGDVIATEDFGGSQFVLRFSGDSRLEWVKVLPRFSSLGPSIARAPDGGVLGSVALPSESPAETSLVSWRADGTPAWTGALGCRVLPVVVSNGDWFMLKSDYPDPTCDLEPGATDPPADGAPYLVGYRF
jgi:hypothetical protein